MSTEALKTEVLKTEATRRLPPAPAGAGDFWREADTPALLLDLDVFEANLAHVHARAREAGVAVRSHAKAHKCVELARRQIAAGAVGLCCQKVSEAEVFANAGIRDLLVTNQLVGRAKTDRAARIAANGCRLTLCVDHPLQIEQAAQSARAFGVTLEAVVELDVGQGRCGVQDGESLVTLALAIHAHEPALRFAGIHAYNGAAQHLRQPQAREEAVRSASAKVREAVALLKQAGLACRLVTGGGTGTHALEAASGIYNEIQPGSYVLMDLDYKANVGMAELGHALSVLCTVISVAPGRAVLDGGLKAFAVDHGLPQPRLHGWRTEGLSDEHAVLVPEGEGVPLKVGDRVSMLPGHCDPTVNLHDWMLACRGERVEGVWSIDARGFLF